MSKLRRVVKNNCEKSKFGTTSEHNYQHNLQRLRGSPLSAPAGEDQWICTSPTYKISPFQVHYSFYFSLSTRSYFKNYSFIATKTRCSDAIGHWICPTSTEVFHQTAAHKNMGRHLVKSKGFSQSQTELETVQQPIKTINRNLPKPRQQEFNSQDNT